MGVVWLTRRIFASAIVNFEKFRHGMLLSNVNNSVDGGPLFLASMTVNASNAIHQGLSSIGRICCGFVAKFNW